VTLKTGLGGCSGSLKMAPVRQTIYDFLLIGHCKYSSILYHFRVIWRWIIGLSRPWNLGHRSVKVMKLVPFQSLGAVSYSSSIVTMALSCIISDYCETLVENRDFSYPALHSTPPLGGPLQNIAIPFGVQKLNWCGYRTVKTCEYMFSRFDGIPACDRRTDRQTNGGTDGRTSSDSIVRAV